jgi:SM-20-related protein
MALSDTLADHVVDDLAQYGWSVVTEFLPQNAVSRLTAEIVRLRQEGGLRPAGVGKGAERNDTLRGDWISWLEQATLTPTQQAYLDDLERLRLAANRALQLGLFDFEGHLAVYPPGSFYRRHLDRFRDDDRRTLTVILYLNPDWQEADGGALRLYLDETRHIDVLPRGGTLVAFLSGRFWHEVLPSRRERFSITGWFRTRGIGIV